ncbi:hypothetical protein KI688_011964 [Linnemannia hyalina]|uniref:Uncharacterized protein n=1 Tax=Linnemannia hyalina TaxID=64524 RepID=A0A9P7XVX1_9FUNG|nr:hypothetical protein KI688_011964 [Linnemannia hyalina]
MAGSFYAEAAASPSSKPNSQAKMNPTQSKTVSVPVKATPIPTFVLMGYDFVSYHFA